jgi:UPF0716 protein FxsA
VFLLLVLFFVCLPVIEIAIFIEVGGIIGLWPVIGIILLSTIIGAQLLRMQGRSAWLRYRAEVSAGRAPSRAAFDRAAVFLAGMLLVFPGFLTDAFALVVLFPPTRSIVRRIMAHWWRGRTLKLQEKGYTYRTDTIEHPESPKPPKPKEPREIDQPRG